MNWVTKKCNCLRYTQKCVKTSQMTQILAARHCAYQNYSRQEPIKFDGLLLPGVIRTNFSLRSWRYCVGARLKFWRRSRDPRKGVGTLRYQCKGYLFHSSGIGKGFGNLSFRSVRTWIIESLSIIHG